MYTYLLINLGSIFFPFLLSFDKKVAFHKTWSQLFPAIAIGGGIFIIWDVFFTKWGVWSFNPEFISGIEFLRLPLGEWLFFVTIPYACLFIYACMNAYVAKDYLAQSAPIISRFLGVLLFILAFVFWGKLYTTVTFLATSVYLILHSEYWKSPWLGRFYAGYLVSLIPFLLVNGLLTALPVVQYNDLENIGKRIYTIPVEDTMYMLLLLLLCTHFYEIFKQRTKQKKTSLKMV